jgi:hypothetical protein
MAVEKNALGKESLYGIFVLDGITTRLFKKLWTEMGPGLNVTFKSFCVIRISVNIR